MKRVEGSSGVQLLECTNPVKNKWRVRWDVQSGDNGNVTYMEHDFEHKPTTEEIKSIVFTWYNANIDNEIVSGFVWNGLPIWLSGENQFNYKAAYDLAVQEPDSLPVTFKFGTDKEPVYHEFSTLEELTDFYMKAMKHIQDTLKSGWLKKDSVDLSLYQ